LHCAVISIPDHSLGAFSRVELYTPSGYPLRHEDAKHSDWSCNRSFHTGVLLRPNRILVWHRVAHLSSKSSATYPSLSLCQLYSIWDGLGAWCYLLSIPRGQWIYTRTRLGLQRAYLVTSLVAPSLLLPYTRIAYGTTSHSLAQQVRTRTPVPRSARLQD
jgi:hypothetical protein